MTAPDVGSDHPGRDGDGHPHGRDHGHHRHEQGTEGLGARLRGWFVPHTHEVGEDAIDAELESSAEGIRAIKLSLVGLGLTAVLQAGVYLATSSVALLSDTLHNVADALTALPLWLAFTVGRRPPNRRYTYGYGRAEDVAGVVIVLAILGSAVLATVESVQRLVDPAEVRNVLAVAAAGVIGFAGNEAVAWYRIRVGRRIGSAALVADGLHARTDGLTSLAVVVSAIGVGLGFPLADPIVGLLVAAAIVLVLGGAARGVYRRLMDAVDPGLVEEAERVAGGVEGVEELQRLRLRWIGHRLVAEVDLAVDDHLDVVAAHEVAEDVLHALLHRLHRLADATVHVNPSGHHSTHAHESIAHHDRNLR